MAGPGSMALIGIAALIIFGPKKLPEIGKALGTTLKEFKESTSGLMNDETDEKKKE